MCNSYGIALRLYIYIYMYINVVGVLYENDDVPKTFRPYVPMRQRQNEWEGVKCVNGKTLSTLNLYAPANFGIHDTCNTDDDANGMDEEKRDYRLPAARPHIWDAISLCDNVITGM